jgi:Kef-type K+ transport system membrane component KefB
MGQPTELDEDILDRGGRLRRLGLAMLIAGVATFFMLTSMINSGRGPSQDPIGQTSVVMMGVIMFVLSTSVCAKFIGRIHAQRMRDKRARAAVRTSAS